MKDVLLRTSAMLRRQMGHHRRRSFTLFSENTIKKYMTMMLRTAGTDLGLKPTGPDTQFRAVVACPDFAAKATALTSTNNLASLRVEGLNGPSTSCPRVISALRIVFSNSWVSNFFFWVGALFIETETLSNT
jgi:hypothetical protein